jgi:hypothetical protein
MIALSDELSDGEGVFTTMDRCVKIFGFERHQRFDALYQREPIAVYSREFFWLWKVNLALTQR